MDQRRNVVKVRLRNPDGDFLAFTGHAWIFTPDRARAAVLDYFEDHLAEQLAVLYKTQGLFLKPEPLDPAEILETCDRCERMLLSVEMHFDGRHFLCPQCRESITSCLQA